MKNFRDAVQQHMEREKWIVFVVKDDLVDLFCIRHGQTKLIRARGNGHGHLYQNIEHKLRNLQRKCGMRVLVAKVNGDNEIWFMRI